MQFHYDDYEGFIDWDKVKSVFDDENDAHKTLLEDFYLFETTKTGEAWAFKKWLKTNKIFLDPILKELEESLGYHLKNQGR